jgi:hypothetical protein
MRQIARVNIENCDFVAQAFPDLLDSCVLAGR